MQKNPKNIPTLGRQNNLAFLWSDKTERWIAEKRPVGNVVDVNL